MTTNQSTSYQERLAKHIDSYLNLTTNNPHVRINEFMNLIEYAQLDNAVNLLEVPLEGKLLELLLPGKHIDRADFLKINATGYENQVTVTDWGLNNIPADHYDAVVSLAPIHHASPPEKTQYLQGVYRALKQNGILAFGEVEAESTLHHFLDVFIHQHSKTGHIGNYPDANFNHNMEQAGFNQVISAQKMCYWHFANEKALVDFMMKLFALKPIAKDFLLNAVDTYLSVSKCDGQLHVSWPLRFYRGIKTF